MTLLRSRLTRRPRVLESVAGRVVCENGFPQDVRRPNRVAVLVHYSTSPKVGRSFRTMVREFATNGYLTVVVSSCPAPARLDWQGALIPETIVLRKPNIGYDFGSWAVGLNMLPGVREADQVILANDSMIGPFTPLSPFIEQFESTAAAGWAFTDTRQHFHHLQSYFLGFRGGVLAEKPLLGFWMNIRHEGSKWDVIRRNELGLSRLLRREGYPTAVAFHADDVVAPGENPVIRGWWRLLENGFPFVKREIITNPAVAPRADMVDSRVRAVFGAHLREWL
ncbi:MAG: rhamnan synthesis F family protein [Nocardioidaceae bacterium]